MLDERLYNTTNLGIFFSLTEELLQIHNDATADVACL